MLRAFLRLGWIKLRQSGSHVVLARGGRGTFTIPIHPGTLKLGTARAILRQAHVTEEEFFEVY
jgi:predicted RNA binding protein YcfA (HicA-like mRNA interferase family)